MPILPTIQDKNSAKIELFKEGEHVVTVKFLTSISTRKHQNIVHVSAHTIFHIYIYISHMLQAYNFSFSIGKI